MGDRRITLQILVRPLGMKRGPAKVRRNEMQYRILRGLHDPSVPESDVHIWMCIGLSSIPDQLAASMAALMMRETAAEMISRSFIMSHEKGGMITYGNEELKLRGQAGKLLK